MIDNDSYSLKNICDSLNQLMLDQEASANTFKDASQDEQLLQSLDAYPEHIQKETLKKLKIISFAEKKLKEGLKHGWTQKNLEPILADLPTEITSKPPSWRILVTWKTDYFESGRSINSLIPKHQKKGKKKSQYDSDYLADKAIKEIYLTKTRRTARDAYETYEAWVIQANKNVVQGKMALLSERTFYRRINNLPPYDVMVARHGERYANNEFRSVGQMYPATAVMQFVEIDHSPLNVMLTDDESNLLGRAYLTTLYDRYSKCIVGLSVNFREPSYHSVRKAMLNALLNKSWLKEKYPNIKKDWSCQGKIVNLVVDNGREFWSASLYDALRPLVSDIIYCPARKPYLKSGVEKFYDILNKGLINLLPGKTFENPLKLKGYNPEKDAVVSHTVFLELLYTWIIDYYHFKCDSRFNGIPYDKWHTCNETPNHYYGKEAEELSIHLGMICKGTIQINGVTKNEIRYQSPKLIDYRKYKSNNASNKNIPIKFKIEPSNLSFIHVLNDETGKYFKVNAVDNEGWTKGLSLFSLKIMKKIRKINNFCSQDKEHLADTKIYLHERIEQAKNKRASNKPSRLSTNRAMAKFEDEGSDKQDNGFKITSDPVKENNPSKPNKIDYTKLKGY